MKASATADAENSSHLYAWVQASCSRLDGDSLIGKEQCNLGELADAWMAEHGDVDQFLRLMRWLTPEAKNQENPRTFAENVLSLHCANSIKSECPRGLDILDSCFKAISDWRISGEKDAHNASYLPNDTPFADLIHPVSLLVFMNWKSSLRTDRNIFYGNAAEQQIVEWICKRFEKVLVPCLYEAFNRQRAVENLVDSYAEKKRVGQSPSLLYQQFVSDIQSDPEAFFGMHSGLIPILAETFVNSQRSISLMNERLDAHAQAIGRCFGDNMNLLQIAGISIGEGDTHDGGLSVAIITLKQSSGEVKIVYKPRSIDIDHHFYQLCKVIKGRYGIAPAEFCPVTLPFDGYGFIGYVDSVPCEDRCSRKNFYSNLGRLLCICRMLAGTDVHYENLIASGEDAILIDCETLFTPVFNTALHPFEDYVPYQGESQGFLRDSVMATMILPKWIYVGPHKRPIDMSAIGVTSGLEKEGFGAKSWYEVNTDLMMPCVAGSRISTIRSLPSEPSSPNPAPAFVDDLCNGFAEMYRCLYEDRRFWLEASSPLHSFRGCQGRIVFRATDFYARILDSSLEAKNLASPTHRQVSLEKLARAFSQCRQEPKALSILQHEIIQISRGDIPAFYCKVDASSLFTATHLDIDNSLILQSGLDHVLSLFERMSEKDLRLQLSLIKGTMDARFATTGQKIQSSGDMSSSAPCVSGSGTAPTCDHFLDPASLFAFVQSLRLGDKDSSWIGYNFYFGKRGISFSLLHDDLPQGRLGICCSLAALALDTNQSQDGDLPRLVADCAETIFAPFLTSNASDLARHLDIAPGLNGITGHLVGGQILQNWCRAVGRSSLHAQLQRSLEKIVGYILDSNCFYDVDCQGSLYTSGYALFQYLTPLAPLFPQAFLNNAFQRWLEKLLALDQEALSQGHGLHEGSLGMLRAALAHQQWMAQDQFAHLKLRFAGVATKLVGDFATSSSLSVSDGVSGTLLAIAEAGYKGWISPVMAEDLMSGALCRLSEELLQNKREISHDLAFGLAGLDWMLSKLYEFLPSYVLGKERRRLKDYCHGQLKSVQLARDIKTISPAMRYQALGPMTGLLGIANYQQLGVASKAFVDVLMAA